ncbi:uncharacterized protein LOC110974124 [Acanthaster planci]|uniref:Uncharacterized protein LOC110974124 n=1 Tax=Acanthaster planci TaxID=133434 RepID=A0A8B7XMI3_ACAPL|nr:uncharacterized protein LOC110974124 [Acanthaster planci]
MSGVRVVASRQKLPFPTRSGVLATLLVCLGLAGLASTRHPQQIHPEVPGVCRAIISKVQSYTESNLRSSLVGVRGGICTWLELNGCQQYKVVFTPVYKIAFRTVYISGFVCCSGYSRVGNVCVPNQPATVVPRVTTPHRPPGNGQPVTSAPPASDNDQDGSSVLAFTGLYMTARPVTPPSDRTDTTSTVAPNPEQTSHDDVDPPAPRDRLLIILLILVILAALFAVASFAFHLARLWHRGRVTCCFGMIPLPRICTKRNASEDSQKINCILRTISSECSTESVRSDLSDLSHRTGSDQSGQSNRSGLSEVTFVSDDSDSVIVKHVVYERCWKDTTSLLSYASSSQTSRESRPKVAGLTTKKCTPLLTVPVTPLNKKRRPSPPPPTRPEPIYDVTPHSPPPPLPLPHPKSSSPAARQPSPGPYSYTSLNKQKLNNPSPGSDNPSAVGLDLAVGPCKIPSEDTTEKMASHAYVNVKSDTRAKLRPVYVTLEPDTDLATECCEDDNDPWMISRSLETTSITSVGYCALSNQVVLHRVSGNGYDKLERTPQNLSLAPESFPRPEYAVPSVTTSTGCLALKTDTEDQVSRASPAVRRSGTMPSITLERLKLSEDISGEDFEQEERYIRAPRHNHKELVFIDTTARVKIPTSNPKHNSVG